MKTGGGKAYGSKNLFGIYKLQDGLVNGKFWFKAEDEKGFNKGKPKWALWSGEGKQARVSNWLKFY